MMNTTANQRTPLLQAAVSPERCLLRIVDDGLAGARSSAQSGRKLPKSIHWSQQWLNVVDNGPPVRLMWGAIPYAAAQLSAMNMPRDPYVLPGETPGGKYPTPIPTPRVVSASGHFLPPTFH
eukprot:9499600-Pyramimonas_sp.AAC.1